MISDNKNKAIILRDVLKFYGVGSVAGWKELWNEPKVAARRSPCFETCPEHASAWIRLGELQGHALECKPYDKKKFEAAVKKIRTLTRLDTNEFIPKMIELCAEAGVALALVPEMKKVPWSGATKWLTPNKAMILLNLRGKGEDLFWFAFFHEAGHVLYDSKKDLYINDKNKDDPKEIAAGDFPGRQFISRYWCAGLYPPGSRCSPGRDESFCCCVRCSIKLICVKGRHYENCSSHPQ